jgi:hypothetical protein
MPWSGLGSRDPTRFGNLRSWWGVCTAMVTDWRVWYLTLSLTLTQFSMATIVYFNPLIVEAMFHNSWNGSHARPTFKSEREAVLHEARIALISAILWVPVAAAIVLNAISFKYFNERNLHGSIPLIIAGVAYMCAFFVSSCVFVRVSRACSCARHEFLHYVQARLPALLPLVRVATERHCWGRETLLWMPFSGHPPRITFLGIPSSGSLPRDPSSGYPARDTLLEKPFLGMLSSGDSPRDSLLGTPILGHPPRDTLPEPPSSGDPLWRHCPQDTLLGIPYCT